jgi:hypothetical protein
MADDERGTVGGVYSVSNRNEYGKRRLMFLGNWRGRGVRLIALPPSLSRLFRQCGIINISQSYRPPRPVTGIGNFTVYTIIIFF